MYVFGYDSEFQENIIRKIMKTEQRLKYAADLKEMFVRRDSCMRLTH